MNEDFPVSIDTNWDGWCYTNTEFSFANTCLSWEQTLLAGLEPLIFIWGGYMLYLWRRRAGVANDTKCK